MKKNAKSIILYIALAMVFISGFMKFIDFGVIVPNENVNLYLNGYQVKGFYGVFAGLMLTVFLYKAKKVDKMFLTILLIGVGYAYNIYTLMNIDVDFSLFEGGFYMFYGAIIPLVIGLVLPRNESEINGDNQLGELPSEVQGKLYNEFIVCYYVGGLKGVTGLYKSPSVLIKKKEDNALNINIKAPEEIKMSIDNVNINKITVSKSVIVNISDEQKKEDYTTEAQYLASVLIGSFGPLIGEKLAEDNSISSKARFDKFFKIEILYTLNGEQNRLVFQTNKEPYYFFESYSNILEKVE